jgi:tetratricopeptide (TPR) repeat protein
MFHLGLMYRRTSKFHEALYYFSKVQEKLEKDKTVYIPRGLVYQDMGNNWKAIEDFNRAIELEDTYSPAHFYLGISKLHDHKPEEAKTHFERALALDINRENPGIYDGLA